MPSFGAYVRYLSPEAYWRLGEQTGSTAADESFHDHTATYVGDPIQGAPSCIADNLAVELDGADDQVTFPPFTLA